MVEQVPVTLVGGGRVGRALAGALGPRGGLAGPVVRRGGRGWDEVPPGRRPVLLCTGAQHLEEAVSECPPERRPDLVFMQNGALEPWLAARGLEGCTRALLYLSAEEGGAGLKDGGGRSSVTGPSGSLSPAGSPSASETFTALTMPFSISCAADHGSATVSRLERHQRAREPES